MEQPTEPREPSSSDTPDPVVQVAEAPDAQPHLPGTPRDLDRIVREAIASAAAKLAAAGAEKKKATDGPAYMRKTPVDAQVYQPSEEINPAVASLAEHVDAIFQHEEQDTDTLSITRGLPSGSITIAWGSKTSYKTDLVAQGYRISLVVEMPADEQCAHVTAVVIGAEHLGGDPEKIAKNLTAQQLAKLFANWNAMLVLLRENKTQRTKESVAAELKRVGAAGAIAYAQRTEGKILTASDEFQEAVRALQKTFDSLATAA